MNTRIFGTIALALLAPLAACAAPTESDAPYEADGANVASQQQPLIGWQRGGGLAGLVMVTRAGSSVVKTGSLIDSTTVLVAASALPANQVPSQVTLTYGSATGPSVTAIDIVRHPTLDVALVKLQAPFPGSRSMVLDTRSPSTLVGKMLTCQGFDTNRQVAYLYMNVRAASGSTLTMERDPFSTGSGLMIENSDGGVPCMDVETYTVVGIALSTNTAANPVVHTQTATAAFTGWVPGAQNLFGVRAQPLARPFSLYYLRNQADSSSRNCLDIPWASTATHAPINQFPCHYGQNQSFYFDYRSSSTHPAIVSAASGLCIDIPGPTSSTIGLQQYPCHGGANQGWEMYLMNPQGSGLGYRSRQYPNRCITGVGAPTFGPSLNVLSDACQSGTTANTQQRWFIRWN